jgi:hypothetical protein
MVPYHFAAQVHELFERQVGLRAICSPGADLEVHAARRITDMIDSREKGKFSLVLAPARLGRFVSVLAD